MIYRIAITGPESTGKSELSTKLAAHYGTVWVQEYARKYLDNLGRPYEEADILKIAHGQYEAEKRLFSSANQYLFCDTEFITLKIWSEFKYDSCETWIAEKIKNHSYHLYLLCNIDLPWQLDPLREHPDKRNELFQLYLDELKANNFPYEIISGAGNSRLQQAIEVIDNHLKIIKG